MAAAAAIVVYLTYSGVQKQDLTTVYHRLSRLEEARMTTEKQVAQLRGYLYTLTSPSLAIVPSYDDFPTPVSDTFSDKVRFNSEPSTGNSSLQSDQSLPPLRYRDVVIIDKNNKRLKRIFIPGRGWLSTNKFLLEKGMYGEHSIVRAKEGGV